MGMVDKFCKKIGIGDTDDIDDLEREIRDDEQALQREQAEREARERLKMNDNVVDFSDAAREHAVSVKMRVMVINPKSFDDAQQVANCLKDKRPVVVNFEDTNSEDAGRIVDFISGTTYALAGEIQKVGSKVFLCAPSNVNITCSEEKKTLSSEMPWMRK
ncbi:MAG: cell division protein SepF [Veillonellaceae bacterium]|nr:cell division protein SepF [Veillonellaceae bacterium]MDD6924069.1 cell division protein SepF [Veillonellaceae bacterium]